MSKQQEINYTVSNPMDLLFDDNYLEEAVAAEALVGGNIGVGLDWEHDMGELLSNLPLVGRLTTLRVSLNREARQLIETWNLGIGTKIATTTARIHIKQRLQSPTPEVEQHLQTVLLQDDLYNEEFIRDQEVLRSLLKVLLTESDWQGIASVAAEEIRKQIMCQCSVTEVITV
jgi:hypothetical protein